MALADRLDLVCVALGLEVSVVADPAERASRACVEIVRETRRGTSATAAAILWLCITAVSTVFPVEEMVSEAVRRWSRQRDDELHEWLIERGLALAATEGDPCGSLVVSVGSTLVDVDFSAKNDHNTGIQRVVRNTVPHWLTNGVELVAWNDGSYSRLDARQTARVVEWDADRPAESVTAITTAVTIVPWKSSIVLAEVPNAAHLDRLRALARYSGNAVAAIGYDTIPVTSRPTVSRAETNKFVDYLSVIKYATTVATISEAVAEEFRGFASMLPAQGLIGPRILSSPLPWGGQRAAPTVAFEKVSPRPLVLCVGSKEPRKNHIALLFAAEMLWRAGHDFELLFIGSYGPDTRGFRRRLRGLQKAGRPVTAPHHTDDATLWRAYGDARFTVFASLHEGFGLPIVESLRRGTPVITSRFGSMGEIARHGGCIAIDPRDDAELVEAMKLLLIDDERVASLRDEALAITDDSWSEYAGRLWADLGLDL
jgi:glycosyltransferase involved in cell wall biosynthesis